MAQPESVPARGGSPQEAIQDCCKTAPASLSSVRSVDKNWKHSTTRASRATCPHAHIERPSFFRAEASPIPPPCLPPCGLGLPRVYAGYTPGVRRGIRRSLETFRHNLVVRTLGQTCLGLLRNLLQGLGDCLRKVSGDRERSPTALATSSKDVIPALKWLRSR